MTDKQRIQVQQTIERVQRKMVAIDREINELEDRLDQLKTAWWKFHRIEVAAVDMAIGTRDFDPKQLEF